MSAHSNSKTSSPIKSFPSTATSHSKSSQCVPKYIPLSRSWPTSTKSSHHRPISTSQTTTGDHKGMSPMQRWENESLKQSYWTNVAEYKALDRTAGATNGQRQNGGGSSQQNWSMIGYEESERF